MTDPITFTQLLIFGTFLLALIVAIFKIGWSVWRLKRNDFGGFIKRKEFEKLVDKVDEMGKTLVRLDERTEGQEKQIDALFKWKNSQ